MSALHIGRLYPSETSLALISVSGLVDPKATVMPEVILQAFTKRYGDWGGVVVKALRY